MPRDDIAAMTSAYSAASSTPVMVATPPPAVKYLKVQVLVHMHVDINFAHASPEKAATAFVRSTQPATTATTIQPTMHPIKSNQKPKTKNQKPKTKNQKPKTKNQNWL
jgi:hypothetical protein